MFEAVLMDMDGTLTDTETLGQVAVHRAAAECGFHLGEAALAATLGLNQVSCDRILQREDPSYDGDRFWQAFRRVMRREVERRGTPLKPGAVRLMDTLSNLGTPCALVSSSPRETIDLYLAYSPLMGRFPVIVSGGEGLEGKPAPDMYLHAAGRLGVKPENCLVLEDSPSGLQAGKAAGMTVWMVPDLIPWSPAMASFCDAVVPSLEEAARRLAAQAGAGKSAEGERRA